MPGEVVADFGVGSGAYTINVAQYIGNHGVVYAFDIQAELLKKVSRLAVEKGLNNIKIMTADFELPSSSKLKEEAVDLIIIANVLFQLKNKENILREAFKILKKTGRILIVDWSDSFGGIGPQPSDVVKMETAQKLAESINFKLVKTLQAGDHHYGLLFKK